MSSAALRERIVEQCQQDGLVWGKELYADATKVQAHAAFGSLKPRFAVEAHLANLFSSELEEPVSTEGPASLPEGDASHLTPPPSDNAGVIPSTEELLAMAAQTRSEASEYHSLPPQLHPELDEATQQALSKSHREQQDWIKRVGEPARSVRHGTYRRMADFWVSTTDSDATMMNGKTGGSKLGYHTHYVVDGGKARIILEVLVTPSARDGESTDLGFALASSLPLETPATAVYWRYHLRNSRNHYGPRTAAHSSVCASSRF